MKKTLASAAAAVFLALLFDQGATAAQCYHMYAYPPGRPPVGVHVCPLGFEESAGNRLPATTDSRP